MAEEDFASQLREIGGSFRAALDNVRHRPIEAWTERSLYLLSMEARTLERFLDAHGAQANRTFYPLRKSLAMVLWLSQALSCFVHLEGRLGVYPTADPSWTHEELPKRLRGAVQGLGMILGKSMEVLVEKWVKAGCEWEDGAETQTFVVPPATHILAANRVHRSDHDADAEAESPALRLAGRFLHFSASWHRKVREGLSDPAAQVEFAKNYCRERTTRSFQARAHNWQSDYDSLIRNGSAEAEDERLLCLRGSMSQALHLLEASTALAHLYERHRPPAAPRPGEEESFSISNFLRSNAFLGHWIRDCVVLAFRCLEIAVPLAEGVVKDYGKTGSVALSMPEGVQWHARPLSLVVGIVLHYGVPVTMRIEDQDAPANSLIQMLLVAGAHPEAKTTTFVGDTRALEDLKLLFQARLGEDGIDKLPQELAYLT